MPNSKKLTGTPRYVRASELKKTAHKKSKIHHTRVRIPKYYMLLIVQVNCFNLFVLYNIFCHQIQHHCCYRKSSLQFMSVRVQSGILLQQAAHE